MKLDTSTSIDGKVVDEMGTVKGITFYTIRGYDSENFTLHLVENGKVIGGIDIACGMQQATGFVDEMDFFDVD